MALKQLTNPKNKQWIQTNNSDIAGNLWATQGIDLTENEGQIRVGKRLLLNTNTSDVAEITSYPAAFKVFNDIKFAIAGASATGYVFSNSTAYPSATTFSKVTAANAPTKVDSLYSDMEISNGKLYVSQNDTNVAWTVDGTTWETVFSAGAASSPHMLTSYLGRTYMTNLRCKIISWGDHSSGAAPTVATSGKYTVDLGNSDANVITFLRSSANRIWIGVVNTTGGKGYIYEWDGASTQTQKSYRLEASGALACVIKDDIPYVLDSNGDVLVWTSGNFKKLTGINRRRNKLLFNPLAANNQRFIHPNGMSIIKGRICALVDGRNYDNSVASTSLEETNPSGVWELDVKNIDGQTVANFYHKYPFGLSRAGGTITDYGAARIAGAGALAELNIPSTTSTRNGTFLAGVTYYTNATSTSSGIFFDDANDTEQKAGSFITTKIQSAGLTDKWLKAFPIYRKFLNPSDRIVVKYRYSEQEPTEMTITWVAGSTQFTTTDANMANYAVGDEVDIVAGSGAGMCSHITAISNNAGTYTVTVDATYPTSTATAKARLQKWIKLGTVSDQTFTFKRMSFPSNIFQTWMQFKVWMLFTGRGEFTELKYLSEPNETT